MTGLLFVQWPKMITNLQSAYITYLSFFYSNEFVILDTESLKLKALKKELRKVHYSMT